MEPSKEPSLTGQGMIQESVDDLHEQEALTYGAREANRQTSGGIALAIPGDLGIGDREPRGVCSCDRDS